MAIQLTETQESWLNAYIGAIRNTVGATIVYVAYANTADELLDQVEQKASELAYGLRRGRNEDQATDRDAAPAPFVPAVGLECREKVGLGTRPVVVIGKADYLHAETSYLIEDIDPESQRESRWVVAGVLAPKVADLEGGSYEELREKVLDRLKPFLGNAGSIATVGELSVADSDFVAAVKAAIAAGAITSFSIYPPNSSEAPAKPEVADDPTRV